MNVAAMRRAVAAVPGMRPLKRAAEQALIARAFADADGFIASYPKAGRTWLRFILVNYFNRFFDLGLTIDLHSMFWVIPNDLLDRQRGRRAYRFDHRAEVPLLVASHAPYRKALFGGRPIVFMLREPKDLMVSAYFHKTRHGGGYQGGIKAFLRDPDHGLADYLRYANGWAARLADHRHLLTSYEQLSGDTAGVVEAVVRFFGVPVDRAALDEAISASRFEAMQAVEVAKGIAGHSHDRSVADSRRVRKGKIGGYREHLDADDIAYADQTCRSELSDAAKQLLARVSLAP